MISLWRSYHRHKKWVILTAAILSVLLNVNPLFETILLIFPDAGFTQAILAQIGSDVVAELDNSAESRALRQNNPALADKTNSSVRLAAGLLGKRCIDLSTKKGAKGDTKLPNFSAAGGFDNNCADFVAAVLADTGRLKIGGWNKAWVPNVYNQLLAQGWRIVKRTEARAGDVWIRANMHHVMLVADNSASKFIGCNNNVIYNIQYVTLVGSTEPAYFLTDRPK